LVAQRPGDLTRRQHESAGRVQDDLDRHGAKRGLLARGSRAAAGEVDRGIPEPSQIR
jgi:hypothetical protein